MQNSLFQSLFKTTYFKQNNLLRYIFRKTTYFKQMVNQTITLIQFGYFQTLNGSVFPNHDRP